MKTAILTDSSCDLAPEQAEALGLHIIPLRIVNAERRWNRRNNKLSATTMPPDANEYEGLIEELLEDHDNVICIHISSKLSQTCQLAREVASRHPGRVLVHDSLNTSGALAMQAERAKRAIDAGANAEDTLSILQTVASHAATIFCIDGVEWLVRNGHLAGLGALVASATMAKPSLRIERGTITLEGQTQGKQAAMQRLKAEMDRYLSKWPKARLTITHSQDAECAEELARHALTQRVPVFLELQASEAIAAHGGPGLCGFSIEPADVWAQDISSPLQALPPGKVPSLK